MSEGRLVPFPFTVQRMVAYIKKTSHGNKITFISTTLLLNTILNFLNEIVYWEELLFFFRN